MDMDYFWKKQCSKHIFCYVDISPTFRNYVTSALPCYYVPVLVFLGGQNCRFIRQGVVAYFCLPKFYGSQQRNTSEQNILLEEFSENVAN